MLYSSSSKKKTLPGGIANEAGPLSSGQLPEYPSIPAPTCTLVKPLGESPGFLTVDLPDVRMS